MYILLIRTRHGSVASTKIPMDFCANTCPKERIFRCSPRSNWMTLPGSSIPGQERLWDGKRPRNCSSQQALSTSCNTGQLKSILLHLYLESAHPGGGMAANRRLIARAAGHRYPFLNLESRSSFELKYQMRSLLGYSVFLGVDRAGEQYLLAAQMSLEQLDLIQRAGERQRYLSAGCGRAAESHHDLEARVGAREVTGVNLAVIVPARSEEHTSELQSLRH